VLPFGKITVRSAGFIPESKAGVVAFVLYLFFFFFFFSYRSHSDGVYHIQALGNKVTTLTRVRWEAVKIQTNPKEI
ncbi:MAG: hypothetical protein M3288_06260, partial [Thermoproteota archaeon]|nr:hypothetical protein [Thermoproteota archaeon]